jgi:hypothetical protein
MEMISINGNVISNPNIYNVTKMKVVANAFRDIDSGKAQADYVATKYKIELKFPYLTKTERKTLNDYIEQTEYFMTVEYINPDFTSPVTGTFYAGDIKSSTFRYCSATGEIEWKDVTFNLIEE